MQEWNLLRGRLQQARKHPTHPRGNTEKLVNTLGQHPKTTLHHSTTRILRKMVISGIKSSQKLYNIKNYQYTSWYAQKSFKRNGKVYYKVTGNKVSGYVWHGYVTPAISKRISTFKSDSSYIKYLNTDKSQKLSRAVLKYFPNAKVSVDLSRRGAGQFVDNKPITKAMTTSNYKHVINLTALSHDLKTSYGSTYSETILNTLDFPVTTTNAAVAKTVNSILIKNGYTQAKISNLIKQGYKLGIYINGGTGISAGKQGYPWTINTNAGTMNNAALFLAK
ncbi:D-alanyl-D-alanine carboxypeptidase [Levilactobacillus brevis]|uniref:D-alanyl-D-alanine carboxypeptidase n=1 Tax=Levilactobacillus brevis TaxID=1580 RepID=UPI00325A7851